MYAPKKLEEIDFIESVRDRVLAIFREAGVTTEADIDNLGCVGLVVALARIDPETAVQKTQEVLACRNDGPTLHCFVGPDQFCLVHGCIGQGGGITWTGVAAKGSACCRDHAKAVPSAGTRALVIHHEGADKWR
jgi:hypothetical protein